MKTYRKIKHTFLLLSVALTLAIIIPTIYANDTNPLTTVQQKLTTIATYRFTGNIEQTLIPVANAGNIGQSDMRFDTHFSGEKTAVDQLAITLRLEGGGFDAPAVNLEQDGAKLYLVENGERAELENGSGLLGPTADQTAYLHAAENVRLKEEAAAPFTIYQFDINGALFADYMRDQAQSQLPPSAQNLRLEASPALQKMTGSGELWIDEHDLPRRQILHLDFPEMDGRYDAVSAMQMDFHFDAETVQQMGLGGSSLSLLAPQLMLAWPTAVFSTISLFFLFFFVLGAFYPLTLLLL